MSTREYRLAPSKETPAKGIGLYTRRPYHKSELIFTEGPLVRVPYKSSQPFMKQLWKHVANDISSHPIVVAFKNLSPYDQKDFLRLHNSRKDLLTRADFYPPDLKTNREISGLTCAFELLGIYLTNFFFLHEDLTGIFKSISRINHACAANAYLVWDRTNSEMRVVAASNIPAAGAEITIDYSEKFTKLGIFNKLEDIREHCRYFYGFLCRCKLCSDSISTGAIKVITPDLERNMVSFHLDELEQKLFSKQKIPCWEIKELRSRYLPTTSGDAQSMGEVGMFATRRILKGQPIYGEAPMFVLGLHQDQPKGTTYTPSVQTAFRSLESAERDAYVSLKKRDPGVSGIYFSHDPALEINYLKEIFVSNAICLSSSGRKERYCEWGVFENLSRVNHSCIPNAVGITYDRRLRGTGQYQHWLHARRDIECGEEITFCYEETLCSEPDVAVRGNVLKDRFVCWCRRCVNDRQDDSLVPKTPLTWVIGYENDIPAEYPVFWVESINNLPTTSFDQLVERSLLGGGKERVMPPLVFNDALIALNKMSKKQKVLIFTKRSGKEVAYRISSLPSVFRNTRQKILHVGKGKKEQEPKGEALERRIKFPEPSDVGNDDQITIRQTQGSCLGKDKGKQRAGSGTSLSGWAMMLAVVGKHDSEAEISWGSTGQTENTNQILGSDFHSVDPASTSTGLWDPSYGKSKMRAERSLKLLKPLSSLQLTRSPSASSGSPNVEVSLANESREKHLFRTQIDPKLSDEYYMSRLGIEAVTAERLERANSLSLKSPTDSECKPEGQEASQPTAMENGGHATDSRQASACGESSSASSRKSSSASAEIFSAGVNSSTGTIVKQPAHISREGSIVSGGSSSTSEEVGYSITKARERYRGTSYTLDRGFVGPSALPVSTTEESLRPGSTGFSLRTGGNTYITPSRGRRSNRGTYRTPDGNFSTSRTDQDRRPSTGRQFEPLGRRTHSGPLVSRTSNPGPPRPKSTIPYHSGIRRVSSGGNYTYGVTERRITFQSPQPRGGNWSNESMYGTTDRQATHRPHQDGDSVSKGVSRGGVAHSDPGYRRAQSKPGSPGAEKIGPGSTSQTIRGPQACDKMITAHSDELARRARELFDRARAGLTQPPLAPERLPSPTGFGSGTNEGSEPRLDSIGRTIRHPSMLGTIDCEEVQQVVNISTSVRAPGIETAGSLHWSRETFPDDESPISLNDENLQDMPPLERAQAIPKRRGTLPLASHDIEEGNQRWPDQIARSFVNRPEQHRSLVEQNDGGSPTEGEDLVHNGLAAPSQQFREPFNRPGQQLVENENPCVSERSLLGSNMRAIANDKTKNAEECG